MYDRLIRWVPRAFILLPLIGLIILAAVFTGPSLRLLLGPTDTIPATVSDKKLVRPSSEGERNPGSRDIYRTAFSTDRGPLVLTVRSVYDDLVIGDPVELDVVTSSDHITAVRQTGAEVYRQNLWWPILIFIPVALLVMGAAVAAAWAARTMFRRAAAQRAWGDANIWDPPAGGDRSP